MKALALALLTAACAREAVARTLDLATTSADVTILGSEGSGSGDLLTAERALAVGDLDGDGDDDVALGAMLASALDGRPYAGVVRVLHGPLARGRTVDFATERGDLVISPPADAETFGYGLAIGDFNGDGVQDLAIAYPLRDAGAAGVFTGAVILYGPLRAGERDLATNPADVTIRSDAPIDSQFGKGMVAGDFTGDCIDDLAIGAPHESATIAGGQEGVVRVFFGSTRLPPVIDLTGRDRPDFEVIGDAYDLGNAMAAGDLTGDGIDELVLVPDIKGHLGDDRVIAFHGPLAQGRVVALANEAADFTALQDRRLFFGTSVSVGDVDGDGMGDLVVGVPRATRVPPSFDDNGAVDVFIGPLPAGVRDARTEPAEMSVLGPRTFERFGSTVLARDLTGDGAAELVVAAPRALGSSASALDAGRVSVVRGPLARGARVDLAATPPGDLVIGGTPADRLASALATGDLDVDGLPDLLVATYEGDGAADARTSSGEVHVMLSPRLAGPSGSAGDADGDGIANACDACPRHADPTQQDADGDGWGDACDRCTLDPRVLPGPDEDGDGTPDACDLCPLVSDARLDTDGDFVGDACDTCPELADASQADADADGDGDACDNCRDLANPDQANADGDGFGDACDLCPLLAESSPSDGDLDGFGDSCDNCVAAPNADQLETDGDGIGDACDTCPLLPNPAQTDMDTDRVGDECDNCVDVPNPDQADDDGDGRGDRCTCADPLPEVPERSLRVSKIAGTADLSLEFDASAVPVVASHFNVAQGTIASFGTPSRYDHRPATGGCRVAGSPLRLAGGQTGTDAYYLVVVACWDAVRDPEGSYGRADDLRSRPERPTPDMLGLGGCP